MDLKERFLKYVGFDTQSDENSTTFPSTEKQKVLLACLAEEMKALGLQEVEMDRYGYVMGTIPATPGYEDRPVIGFISHVDTSPDMSGKDVKPQIIEHYDGGDIRLNDAVTMTVAEFPELPLFKGQTLIATDGTTLLGADDKAGVAEIMTAAEYLMSHPEVKHGKIRIGFTPDEEIGRGVDYFDVTRFGAQYAYTVDGGYEGELEYENFNAASARFEVQGKNIHPGSAKDKMLNALQVVCEINAMLPPVQRPEHTEGYEGFYHLISFEGSVEKTVLTYIIRDHDRDRFERRKKELEHLTRKINNEFPGCASIEINDQYYNMREKVEPVMHIVDLVSEAMRAVDVVPMVKPVRGGTDGAQLSFKGLPCPNIFAGGLNFHGRYEFVPIQSMEKATEVIVQIARMVAEK